MTLGKADRACLAGMRPISTAEGARPGYDRQRAAPGVVGGVVGLAWPLTAAGARGYDLIQVSDVPSAVGIDQALFIFRDALTS